MEEQYYRYCEHCGSRFAEAEVACPACGRRWYPAEVTGALFGAKATLETLDGWRRAGLITSELYGTLRADAETRFRTVAARQFGTFDQPPPPPPLASSLPLPPPPPAPPGPGLTEILAARQADILLYLGAFLLGIAALIFVSYQGNAVNDAVQFLVLLAYTLAGIVGGLLVRRWDRVREAGHVFLALGALLLPLNFVLLYTSLLRDGDVSGELVWLIASVFCGLFYGALAWRGVGTFYWVPAAVAVLSGWSSLVWLLDIPLEWVGAWFMLLAAMIPAAFPARFGAAFIVAAAVAVFAIAWSAVATNWGDPWQLPATFALALAGTGAAWLRLRAPSILLAGLLLSAATIAAALWALGAPPPAFAYPFLASGALSLAFASRRPGVGSVRDHPVQTAAWWYGGAMALAPLLTLGEGEASGWSVPGLFASAALMAYLAWRNTHWGFTALVAEDGAPGETHWSERTVYAWASAAFAHGGIALLQDVTGITQPRTGWVFALLSATPALAVAVFANCRTNRGLVALIPISAATALLALPTEGHALHATAFLLVPGAAWAAAFPASGRWTAAVTAAGFFVVAAFALRAHFEWAAWVLALGFAAAGLVPFWLLTPLRAYRGASERSVCVLVLSWSLQAVALLTAATSILAFQADRIETGRDLFALIVERGDYRTLVLLVAFLAGMLAWEGYRLRSKVALITASAAGVVAFDLAVGLANPANVQAYTAPIGIYLLILGLISGRSPELVAGHLRWHEIALLAGAAFLVLPQVEQSFEPGGAPWGLVLAVEGLAFLALGMVLHARWLVPVGILVLTGVAIRWLIESGDTFPYWLTLGALGTALLAGGLFILLNAEWWARIRADTWTWWTRAGDAGKA